MELKGTVKRIGEIETFPSGFQKRNIVVRTIENYPQEILIEFNPITAIEYSSCYK